MAGVAHRIDAGQHASTDNEQRIATDDDVVAQPAVENVVAAAPIERIVEFIPGDNSGRFEPVIFSMPRSTSVSTITV